MSRHAERPGEGTLVRRLLGALTLLIGVGLLPGCALLGRDATDPPPVTSAAPAPPAVVDELTDVLRQRSRAVRGGAERRYTAGLVGDPGFRAQQATYFDDLAQLPLADYRLTFDPRDMVRVEEDYWVVVQVRMQLDGFDAVPVTTRDRYLFHATPRGFKLASVTDPAWEERNQVSPQPWDLGPIEVREVAGVLGVFDSGSGGQADQVLDSVQRGIADVSAVVPYDWSHTVVVYALSDPRFLDGLDDLPGGDPEVLDGVSFPVYADDTDPEAVLAGSRFVLSPGSLALDEDARDRLVRHELTHVAIGEHDDHAPVWLSEGIAEYVSVRPLAPADRLLSSSALDAAATGLEPGAGLDLPDSATFNDDASEAHYGLAWWACEWLASAYGEDVLWRLLDEGERDAETTPTASPSGTGTDLLEQVTGIGSRELARKAARLMVVTYGADQE